MRNRIKLLLTGGSGALGSQLAAYMSTTCDVFAPSSGECNILSESQLEKAVGYFNPNIVVHLAAFVDTFGCESDRHKALDVNVIGTINVAKACIKANCKLVYVSSEYVFSGQKGLYSVYDRLDPINVYGKTKAAAEYVTSTVPDYQIIRAPFIKKAYSQVFVDQFCTRYFLDDAVKRISFNILNNENEIVHIAPRRATLYEHYLNKGHNPEPIPMDSVQSNVIPRDSSLIDNSL